MGKQYAFDYIDEFGGSHAVTYRVNEYANLMILLFDQQGEDWGDCKGRAWCGTCHIEIQRGVIDEPIDVEERNTLTKLGNLTASSRLACQLPADESLDGVTFSILKDE